MSVYIDTHCHLNHPDYRMDLGVVLKRAEEAGVERILCVGYDMETSVLAVKLARDVSMISAAIGVHPHDADTFSPDFVEQLRELAADREHVVAIGETGLDYFRSLSPHVTQQRAFRRHIELAHELELPLIVHSRDAQEDVLQVLIEAGLPPKGVVMHCLPADGDFARRSVEMGCYVGLGGTVTFKNAQPIRDIVSGLPIDRLLLETDAPYLTPHPYRGQRNEPGYLPLIASSLAEAQGVSLQDIADQTTANARRLFGF